MSEKYIIGRDFINDSNLTWAEKGILAYIRQIKKLPTGKDIVEKSFLTHAIYHLIDKGYLIEKDK